MPQESLQVKAGGCVSLAVIGDSADTFGDLALVLPSIVDHRPNPAPAIATATDAEPQAHITVYRGGSAVEIDTGTRPRYQSAKARGRGPSGPFNWRTRRAMQWSLGRLLQDEPALFITRTVRAEFAPTPVEWERANRLFRQRMARLYPGMGVYWRRAFQANGVPHRHDLTFGVTRRQAKAGCAIWLEVSGQPSDRNTRRYSYHVKETTVRNIAGYISKHEPPERHRPGYGNHHGTYGTLPWAEPVKVPISPEQAYALVGATRDRDQDEAHLKGWRGVPPSSPHRRRLIEPDPTPWHAIADSLRP